ncbi:MAG TPA: hypothetical protein PKV80_17315 [Leptospiraceae bacterium]|nr:hypothetical protein [Leptospiraceae bacterium]HNI94558.1 hypothetical protein [Leptospiraceae bacterium]
MKKTLLNINLLYIFTVYLFSISLLSEESAVQKTNWSIQYAFGSGKTNTEAITERDKVNNTFLVGSVSNSPAANMIPFMKQRNKLVGNSYSFRFSAEYLSSSGRFGFITGLTGTEMDFTVEQNGLRRLGLLNLILPRQNSLFGLTPLPQSAFMTLLDIFPVYRSAMNRDTVSYSVPYMDFGLTVHILPRRLLDPYFVFGGSGGFCGKDCSARRGFARFGLRLNFERMYFFLEGEKSVHVFRTGKIDSRQIFDESAFFGFGINI